MWSLLHQNVILKKTTAGFPRLTWRKRNIPTLDADILVTRRQILTEQTSKLEVYLITESNSLPYWWCWLFHFFLPEVTISYFASFFWDGSIELFLILLKFLVPEMAWHYTRTHVYLLIGILPIKHFITMFASVS